MRRLAQLLATGAGRMSRLLGRGGGTSLPGNLLLRLRPNAAAELAGEFDLTSIVVSATNGKTTTARLITSTVEQTKQPLVANTAGANLLSGVTTALLAAQSSKPRPTVGVFEVDEAALPAVLTQVAPDVIVLMNLFRDQLDRYGELETLLDLWKAAVIGLDDSITLVLNADDPGIASLADHHNTVVWFGVDDPQAMRTDLSHAADSTRCRRCQTELAYDGVTIGHFGHWRCPNCDNSRPTPDIAVRTASAHGLDRQRVTLDTPNGQMDLDLGLPGLHNAYNAAAAVAALRTLGASDPDIIAGIESTKAAFGRAEKVMIDDHPVWLLLAKNPTGANENIRTILNGSGLHGSSLDGSGPAGSNAPAVHVLALLNDRTADGRDVSWIWDVDYEQLLPHMEHLTVSGDRAHDLGLRFRYAGIDPDMITVETDPSRALDSALAATPEGMPLFVLPTYTAMLDLRAELTNRGITAAFWDGQ